MTARALLWIGLGLLAATILFAAIAVRYAPPARPLTAITSPTFPSIHWPPVSSGLRAMDAHLHRPAGHDKLARLVPDQAGVFWIGLIVVLVAGIDYTRPWHPRNLDLIAAQAVAWFFWEVLTLFEETQAPDFLSYIRAMFTATVAVSLWLAGRSVWLRFRPYADRWRVSSPQRMLICVAAAVAVLSLETVFVRTPDDSSYFSNLGGQRLRERGLLPYGDPLLTATPGSAYAPGMYMLHAGMQAVLRTPLNNGYDGLALSMLNSDSHYMEPPAIATQLLLAIFQLLAIGSLAWIGWAWEGAAMAAALVSLYCASAAVLGTGGSRESLMGVTFVSHIIPPAMTLAAFALMDNPWLAGAGLAVAAWTGFYPAFFAPIWLGWQAGRSWKHAGRFAAAFALISVGTLIWVLMASRPAPGLSLLATITRDTFGHHTDPAGYGNSPFGLWGQATGVFGFLAAPLFAQSPFTAPFFLMFAGFLIWGAWASRGTSLPGVALLTAAAGIGAAIWKVHATATYLNWFYPFLLLGFLGSGARSNK